MAARALAVVLLLESLWLGLGSIVVSAYAVAFSEFDGRQPDWAIGLAGLVGLAIAGAIAATAIRMISHWDSPLDWPHARTWLTVVGGGNLAGAAFWLIPLFSVDAQDKVGPVAFFVLCVVMATSCLLAATRAQKTRTVDRSC